jgi:hypothetical protein
MPELTLAGQDFGNGIVKVEFDMLAPGMTKTSITADYSRVTIIWHPGKFGGPLYRKPVTQPIPKDCSGPSRLFGQQAHERTGVGRHVVQRAAEMLRIDLEAAGIPYVVEGPDGLLNADFHSLRHSFLTFLARSGVHPKLSQALARHCTIMLTLDRYSHVQLLDEAAALEALPRILPPKPGQAANARQKRKPPVVQVGCKRRAI